MEKNKRKALLKYLIDKRGYKNKEIAEKIGIGVTAFSSKLNGKNKFNENEKMKLLDIIPEIKNYPELLVKL